MLDKMFYVFDESDMPLYLLQSVVFPFLLIGTMTDYFHSSGNSSLSNWKK